MSATSSSAYGCGPVVSSASEFSSGDSSGSSFSSSAVGYVAEGAVDQVDKIGGVVVRVVAVKKKFVVDVVVEDEQPVDLAVSTSGNIMFEDAAVVYIDQRFANGADIFGKGFATDVG